jgi:hypothetical protein
MIATAIPAAIRPYSMAGGGVVLQKTPNERRHECPPCAAYVFLRTGTFLQSKELARNFIKKASSFRDNAMTQLRDPGSMTQAP